jgi:uncharacterized membrane protein YfcA
VPLLASAVFFDEDTSTWGAIVFVLVWIGIAYLVLVPAAIVVRRRGRGGRVLFTIGMAAVALAESLTIGGGFAAAPGLAWFRSRPASGRPASSPAFERLRRSWCSS